MHATCSSVQQGDTCHMPHAPQQTTAKAETMSRQQQQGKMSDAMMMMILCLIATTDKVLKFMAHREGEWTGGGKGVQSQKKRGSVVKLPEIEF